jgi:hypothetical protein
MSAVELSGARASCLEAKYSFFSTLLMSGNYHPGLFPVNAQIKQVNFRSHFQKTENGGTSMCRIAGACQCLIMIRP